MVISHLEQLASTQADGSPLTPVLKEAIDHLKAAQDLRAEHSALVEEHGALVAQIEDHKAEIAKLRALTGVAGDSINEPDLRAIKDGLEEKTSKPTDQPETAEPAAGTA